MGRIIYLNGDFVDEKDAKVSVFDHGLLYGDGVFEGIRVYSGKVFKLKEHLNRLYESANAIGLVIPLNYEQIHTALLETVSKNSLRDGYIRLVVTRGIGDLGLDPKKCPEPTIFIIADKIELYGEEFYKRGISLITSSIRRNIPDALNPKIKSLNYLNNILARMEANSRGVSEALMLNREGYVVECSGVNIFVVKKDLTVITPPDYIGALSGITRGTVIDICKTMNIFVKEIPFTLFDVYNAKECFVTGTAGEVVGVVEIDKRLISEGVPGKLTKEITKRFRELVNNFEESPDDL